MKRLVKWLAGLLNVGLIVFVAINLGGSHYSTSDYWVTALALAAPLVSLWFLFLSRNEADGRGWLGLWMRRKALEEEKKIKALESQQP